MKRLNIVLTGIGGQGVITAAVLVAEAALRSGLEAVVAETHGLSQRGGTVIVHVRVGERVDAPLIPLGGADLVIALEPLEALRYIGYARQGATIVVNTYVIPPPLPNINVPEVGEVVEALSKLPVKLYTVNATRKAIELGDARAANTYLIGFAAGVGGFADLLSLEDLENAVRAFGRNVEVNLRALHQGYEDGRRALEGR